MKGNFPMALRVGAVAIIGSMFLKVFLDPMNKYTWLFGALYGVLSAVLWCLLVIRTGQVLIARDESARALIMEGISSLILPVLTILFLITFVFYRTLKLWYRLQKKWR